MSPKDQEEAVREEMRPPTDLGELAKMAIPNEEKANESAPVPAESVIETTCSATTNETVAEPG